MWSAAYVDVAVESNWKSISVLFDRFVTFMQTEYGKLLVASYEFLIAFKQFFDRKYARQNLNFNISIIAECWCEGNKLMTWNMLKKT